MEQTLEFIFSDKFLINPADLWKAVSCELERTNLRKGKFRAYGKVIQYEKIVSYLDSREENYFNIESDKIRFHFFRDSDKGFYSFRVFEFKEAESISDLWVDAMTKVASVVVSWLCDSQYCKWQNAKSLQLYEYEGKKYQGLPTIYNSAAGRDEVDISSHPGRRIFRDGYIEAVGSTMWLGDKFFELTGASKEVVKAADWLDVSEESPGILKVVAQEKPFTTDQGEEGELQDKMRDLLFPRHKELDAKRRELEG